jgi:hypothetical protein
MQLEACGYESSRWNAPRTPFFTAGESIEASPVLGPDGTVYVASQDGNLYALVSSSPCLAPSPWPMFRHDPRHTGNRATFLPGRPIPSLLLLLPSD